MLVVTVRPILWANKIMLLMMIILMPMLVGIKCPPLLSQIVNSTVNHIGSVVSATCSDTDTWSDRQPLNVIVAVCDRLGGWQPAVPDCIRK